jgi:serine protease Do
MGIVVSNLSKSGNNQGVGFAVVAAYAKIAMEDLLRPPHRVQRGFLGVGLEHLGSDEANVLNIEGGVIVKEVLRDHPAERAGLKARDVLVRINGQQVKDMNHARQLISSTRPGIEIPIGLLRFTNQKSPELLTLRVTLDERVDPAR